MIRTKLVTLVNYRCDYAKMSLLDLGSSLKNASFFFFTLLKTFSSCGTKERDVDSFFNPFVFLVLLLGWI